jgi:hypothetical protein
MHYFKHNGALCIAALLERLGTESDIFLAFDKLLDAGTLSTTCAAQVKLLS